MTEDLQKQNNYCPRAMECDRHRGFTEYPLITLSLFTKGGDVEWGGPESSEVLPSVREGPRFSTPESGI